MTTQLILGDCIEKMKDIPDGSIDAVICDPPYGSTACAWDTVIPFEPMWKELERVTKKNGAIVLFGSQPFTSALIMSNPKMFKYEWVWNKKTAGNFAQGNRQPLKIHENILVFYKEQPTYNPQKRMAVEESKRHLGKMSERKKDGSLVCGAMGYSDEYEPDKLLPVSIQQFKRDGTVHPTQKPIALMQYLVRTYTNEGETVLDFTMGSGTTGVACRNLKRNFIGIESEERYLEIARERIFFSQNNDFSSIMNPAEFLRETIDLVRGIETRFLELGARLYNIKEKQLWKETYDSFPEFLETAKITPPMASILCSIHKGYIVDGKVPVEQLEGIGYSNLYSAIPLIEKEGIESAVVKAQTLTRSEIKDEVRDQEFGEEHAHTLGETHFAFCTECKKLVRLEEKDL